MESTVESPVLFEDPAGPIERLTWGRFLIRGEQHGEASGKRTGKGKDIRITGSKVRRWKGREGHRLKKSMIEDVCNEDIEVLIIGTGIEGGIEVPEKVRNAVAKRGIAELYVERTPEACRRFNELHRAGKRVALLAHGTC